MTAPHPAEQWLHIPCATGHIVTNSAEDMPEGVAFVAVETPDGERLGWWATVLCEHDLNCASRTLDEFAKAAGAERSYDNEYGFEDCVRVPCGTIRVCADRTYIRVVRSDGTELDAGSAYWTVEEITEDPEVVWGAVLGAAAQLD